MNAAADRHNRGKNDRYKNDALERVLAHLDTLVAFPSESRTSNRAMQDWMASRLEALGAQVEVITGEATDRANLVATIGGPGSGGLLLSGHTDVVPVGGGWATDPWSATRIDDRVYGRGTADMKGFFAAVLVALELADRSLLRRPVHVVASYDEEIGCQGVRDVLPLLAARPGLEPELVVIGEPTLMRPRHGHLGKQMYTMTVRAAEAHSSRAALTPSAIAAAAELIGVLSQIQRECPGDDPDAPPYTVNCGTIRGGSGANVIAGKCELVFEVRHDVDHNPTDVLAPFFVAVAEADRRLHTVGGSVTCDLVNSYPAMRTDAHASAYARAVRIADAGQSTNIGFGTEGGLFAEVFTAPIMICGPGDIADAHRPDESVALQQLNRCVQFLTSLISEFCTD